MVGLCQSGHVMQSLTNLNTSSCHREVGMHQSVYKHTYDNKLISGTTTRELQALTRGKLVSRVEKQDLHGTMYMYWYIQSCSLVNGTQNYCTHMGYVPKHLWVSVHVYIYVLCTCMK